MFKKLKDKLLFIKGYVEGTIGALRFLRSTEGKQWKEMLESGLTSPEDAFKILFNHLL